MPTPDEKKCGRCQQVKPRSAFGISRARYDGLQGYCRACRTRREDAGVPPRHFFPAEVPKTRAEHWVERRDRHRERWAAEDPYANPSLKRCSSCKQDRPRQDFTTNRNNTDGLHYECRVCNADRSSLRRAKIRGVQVENVSRQAVWVRDEGTCYLCGLPADTNLWDLDHIRPLAHGGDHSYDNVAVTHPTCNRSKNDTEWPDVAFDPDDLGSIRYVTAQT